ncbi:MAG TPA: phospholipid carrier-dependent glycosyltransferase, partial [Burkholderiales bacterium]|nr:phospholipid carrier-dependent glycosyltransferase [Burkholderiales bacterium]
MPTTFTPRRHVLLVLLLAFAAVWFGNLDYRKLVRPDEGRYAEIPREMVATGDWLTPRLNGIKYFEKPPLQYWATAAAYEVFGEHQWSVRIWPALTGFAGVLLAWLVGLRLFGSAAAFYAALVLASSLIYVVIGHLATLDMGLTFFMSLAMAGLAIGLSDKEHPSTRQLWIHLAWAGMALAMLSKGLIGILLPLFALGCYAVVQRDLTLWRRLHPVTGALVFAVIAAPWFIAVSVANPEFPWFFFVHEHFARYLTEVHHRTAPWWYFFPLLAVGILPWFVTLMDALWRAFLERSPQQFQPQRFLAIWAIAIFAFFSLSSSKLPSYIVPIFPALALLIGARLATYRASTLRWHALPLLLVGLFLVLFATLALRFAQNPQDVPLYDEYVQWLRAAGSVACVGALFAIYRWERGSIITGLIAVAFSALLAEQLAMMGHDTLSPRTSFYSLAQQVKPFLGPKTRFYSVGTYEQTLPFYLKRTVTLVAFADEMAYG